MSHVVNEHAIIFLTADVLCLYPNNFLQVKKIIFLIIHKSQKIRVQTTLILHH